MNTDNIKMNMDGTIRARVLQYAKDGNTLTEKWETLTKHAEGIYYNYTPLDQYGHRYINIVFAKNGVFWRQEGANEDFFDPDSYRYAENMAILDAMYRNYETNVLQSAENGGWINKLRIIIMERLGYDVAPLWAAYEARKRKWAEDDNKRIEAAKKAEQERKEAENRRKVVLLADGKEKLMAHKVISVEQIEILAKAVNLTIHGRTLGFMRERVTEARLNGTGTVSVWGRKLTQRNISGMADVVREIASRLNAQANTLPA